MTASLPRRALRGFLGADRSHLTEPPARDGYSVARRALAGLLGVRLVTPEEQAGPIPPATSTSPGEDRHISAAAAIAAADPVVRLTVRRSPLVVAVLTTDLLVRAIDIADILASIGGRVEDSDLARPRPLSPRARPVNHALALAARDQARDLARDLDRALALTHDSALALTRDSALALARNLTLDRALTLTHDLTPPLDRNLDLDLALDRALDLDLARALDRALARARALDRDRTPEHAFYRNGARARTRALDRTRTRALDRALDRARELADVLAGALSDSLGIEHLAGLVDALLNGALDDFSQADLSGVDLAHIGLVGVHWSVSGTCWPPGLDVEALMQQSEETEPGSGIYVITRRGETERASEEVLV